MKPQSSSPAHLRNILGGALRGAVETLMALEDGRSYISDSIKRE